MAWTEDDITQLSAAIASGVFSVTYSGPPARTVTYQDLDKMRALLAEMKADVARQAGTSVPYRRVSFRKGFRDA